MMEAGPRVRREVFMAKAALATQSVDIEAIDRLEQKLKMLVTVLDRTRAESARATDELVRARAESARASEELVRIRAEHGRANEENARLRGELETARARVADAEASGAELTVLRTERDQIRSRVDDMLRQIEAINL
jgi:chromosome segregation ATPase